VLEDDLTGKRLGRSDRCGEIQPVDGRLGRGSLIPKHRLLAKVRMQLLELPHLAIGSPAQVAVTGVSQAQVRDPGEPTRPVETGGELVGYRLVVDEAVRASRVRGLFVQAHRVEITTLDAGNFGANQGRPVLEILRTMLCPEFELPIASL